MLHARIEVWAILEDFFRAALLNFSPESIVEARSEAELLAIAKPIPKIGGVARVPVMGSITHRDSIWSSFFGGTSVERLTKTFRDLGSDSDVSTVMLDIHSPGGTVSGLPELAAEARALRGKKHVVALANTLTASAAYWLASQADEIVATPEALVGSIGVFTTHDDYSAMLARIGINTTYISAGKYKTEANPDEPLTDEARAHLQSIVDDAYGLFVGDVAAGRGVTPAQVRADYGQGRVLTAGDAKDAGMIDRVATSDETMRRLTGLRAEAEIFPQAATIEPVVIDLSNSLTARRRRLELLKKI
jgi:signal peptide peptidase SppA